MEIFRDYANFYDNLYKDKDYKKECNYLEKVFKKYSSKKVRTILDLGCGTGSHDLILAKRGYRVTGLDFSKNMLTIARKKAKKLGLKIDFYQGDIRNTDLKKKFDAVIAMFAVIGYQITNVDFEKALLTAYKHLYRNGLFIFDVWFGPAVLADKPKSKIKKVKLGKDSFFRRTRCQLDLLKQIVDIYFETKYYSSGELKKTIKEWHKMRFFFFQEIEYFLKKANFQLQGIFPFLKLTGEPTERDWNITVVTKRI